MRLIWKWIMYIFQTVSLKTADSKQAHVEMEIMKSYQSTKTKFSSSHHNDRMSITSWLTMDSDIYHILRFCCFTVIFVQNKHLLCCRQTFAFTDHCGSFFSESSAKVSSYLHVLTAVSRRLGSYSIWCYGFTKLWPSFYAHVGLTLMGLSAVSIFFGKPVNIRPYLIKMLLIWLPNILRSNYSVWSDCFLVVILKM